MPAGQRIDVFFGQAEVDDVHDFVTMSRLPADEEILRLDVSLSEGQREENGRVINYSETPL